MQRELKKQSRKKSRKKKVAELKSSDSRLRIDEIFQEKQSKIVEKEKEKLDFLINNSKYDINNPESIPMVQNYDERERDILMVIQQQNEINKIQRLKELQKIEHEIQEEQFNNYELETEFSEMNSQKQTNKLMFINDEVLPDIFRLITFCDDNIDENMDENINDNIDENIDDNIDENITSHTIQTKHNLISKESSSNIVKI